MMSVLLGFVLSRMHSRNPRKQHTVVCCIHGTEHIHKIQQLKFFYKLVQNHLPFYFYTFSVTQLGTVHDHVTRNINLYKTFRVTHKFGEKILRYSSFRTINDVPDIIRNKVSTHSFKGFSDYCKTFFISNYTAECEIVHCYVCNR